jgi:hypothetical protein
MVGEYTEIMTGWVLWTSDIDVQCAEFTWEIVDHVARICRTKINL